ncbi:MAG: TIR domain-containing protein [Candidatus Binatia bacterium]
MSTLTSELNDIQDQLHSFVESAESQDVTVPLKKLEDSAAQIGKAWSGSWFGYHSRVYYKNLLPPPPGAHFSSEWGSIEVRGEWEEYNFDDVRSVIMQAAGDPDLSQAQKIAKKGEQLFEEKREQLFSILQLSLSRQKDSFVERLLEEAKKTRLISASDFVTVARPSGTFMSRDTLALSQGLWTPPHIAVLSEVWALRSPIKACADLLKVSKRAAAHLERVNREQRRAERIGTNVFIGHGRSLLWKDLKDFVQDRLRLPWDEFNRVPIAGTTNIARLSEMLDAAALALLVMTAEDEQTDGKVRARMNVVHEAGLFQGRLGFTKAIILLEEGCEEFSNIQGLGQIRFPKGNIKAAFEEIRQVLEREKILES